MSRTQVQPTSNLDNRIARLDEGAKRMIRFHSGNRPDAPISLLEALEDHYRRFPNTPVISIHRRPSCNRRKGAMGNVTCGICSETGKFQRIADHVVSEHFKLALWYCGLNSCSTSVSRKSDLDRHRCDMHGIPRPRKAKAERRSQVSSPVDFPASPPTPSLSPGLGPVRNNGNRSRSRDPSTSPSYSVHSPLVNGVELGDNINWPTGNARRVGIQHHSAPSYPVARGRHTTGRPLTLDGGVHPTLVLPGGALPTGSVPSLPDETSRVFCPTHSRNSSYGLGIGISSDAIRLSEQKATHTLPPSTPNRQVKPFHAFDGYSPSDFLSPQPRASVASSSGIGLLPLPRPVHRVTTPIQSKSVQLEIYHAPNLSEGMHLALPPSSPHYPPIYESSQGPMESYPMTLSPDYYPPRAQINMRNGIPVGSLPAGHWIPARNTPPSRSYTPYPVDEDFAFNFGATDDLFSPPQ